MVLDTIIIGVMSGLGAAAYTLGGVYYNIRRLDKRLNGHLEACQEAILRVEEAQKLGRAEYLEEIKVLHNRLDGASHAVQAMADKINEMEAETEADVFKRVGKKGSDKRWGRMAIVDQADKIIGERVPEVAAFWGMMSPDKKLQHLESFAKGENRMINGLLALAPPEMKQQAQQAQQILRELYGDQLNVE